MPIKIVHTADLHLDSPLQSLAMRDEALQEKVITASRGSLERMVDFCIAEGISAFLISGDLFDRSERSAKTAAYLVRQFERLVSVGVQVFYIKGNHDAENPITGEIQFPPGVHTFDGKGGKIKLASEVWIHGVSFRDRHAPESLLGKFQLPEPNAVNIAMLHTSLAGAAGHDPYAPCSIANLKDMGFDYWALGHVHKRQVHLQSPWIVMPGNPQGRDVGESGPKSATLLTIESGKISIEEISTSLVEFRDVSIVLDGAIDDDSIRKAIRRRLTAEAASVAEAAVVRISLDGQSERAWHVLRDRDVWTEIVKQAFEDTRKLWLDKMSINVVAPDNSAAPLDAPSEVQDLMTRIASEDGFLVTANTELEQVLSALPPSIRASIAPDATAVKELMARLTRNAVRSMAAMMRGKDESQTP